MEQPGALSGYLNLLSNTSTFVSIDVADSTALKMGENEQDTIYSFLSYHKLIRQHAYVHHGEVISISGDGMLCRFQRPEDAAGAVQSILAELPTFNKRQNRMSRPFAIRLGVHTGEVLQTEGQAAGQIISHTLDLAAKLQQTAPPNHARFSEETASLIKQTNLPLTRIGWDAKLKVNVYQYGLTRSATVAARRLPNPVKILLVEPELDELMRLKKILFTRNHETLAVYSIHQAALCSQRWKPHVIMISGDLPWETGWELLKGLRANAQVSTIPIILMSQQTTGDVVEKCFALGGNGFLRKPLDEQQIVKRVEMVLREFYL